MMKTSGNIRCPSCGINTAEWAAEAYGVYCYARCFYGHIFKVETWTVRR